MVMAVYMQFTVGYHSEPPGMYRQSSNEWFPLAARLSVSESNTDWCVLAARLAGSESSNGWSTWTARLAVIEYSNDWLVIQQ